MRKTKIVATLGPASRDVEMLEKLLRAGVDIFRLNFSQADWDEQQARVDNIRTASQNTGLPVQIMQDLPGPKIRLGNFGTETIELAAGDIFTLTTDDIVGDRTRVSVNYPLLPSEVSLGNFVYIDDGKIKMEVVEIKGNDVVCKVLVGGMVSGQKGLNLPGSKLSVKSLTEKDIADLEFGIANKVDFVALSFVRAATDILELRKILNERDCSAKIVAKIETPQAMENIDAIIAAADWLMVARGDLAIETPFEKVPIEQKIITEKCNAPASRPSSPHK